MRPRRSRLTFESLESRYLMAAEPIITEFMASNSNSLEDGDGARPDWIEIYNNGDQPVNLSGYRLTDDPADSNKWTFPSTLLEPGRFLIVFASGDNTPDSAGNPHTNFSLSDDGEYVALFDPEGGLLSEFGMNGSDYPAQTEDVSYGLAMNGGLTDAVTPNSAARYLIPTNASLDASWMNPGFDDTGWNSGTASLGYENSPADFAGLIQTALPTGTTSAYVRMSFDVPDADTSLGTLRMKFDDGFIAYINGVRVASANAPAVGAYNSVATADNPDPQAVNYVDFDLSGYSSLLNAGVNTLAVHMLNRSPSSDMLSVPNLVLTSGGVIEPQIVGNLTTPTPGLPNTHLRASDVSFSRAGGVFVGSFELAMTAAATDTIRYTTDGTNPTASSPLYTGPITVQTSQQFRVRSFGPDGQVGVVHTQSYVNASSSVGSVTSDLPIIVLENFGGGVPDANFQDSTLALYDVDPVTGTSSLAGPPDVASVIGQHRRGKSTFNQPKLNLRIELRDNFGEDRSESLLGMPTESDWILYAPWTIDRAMVRNALIYDLSRQAGHWAPRTRFVEVYSNYDGGQLSESDYVGVYVLMEVIKRDDHRVDISELTPSQNTAPAITGGYILQIDEGLTDDESWDTSRNYPQGVAQFIHVEPERSDMTTAQVNYIRGYVQEAENALFGPNSTSPTLGYQAYFDVDAAIDFHIFNVFSANPDAFRLSTYLTKDRDGKLAYGPLWDFDRAMGPDVDDRSADPTKWMSDEAYFWVTQYWGKMLDDPNFEQRWVDRWQELRQTVFSDANLQTTLESHTSQLTQAQERNAAKWGSGVAPNGGPLADPGLTGWQGEISHLENWLVARAQWIDTQTIAPPTFSPQPGFVAVGSQVTFSPPPGASIYYTLDGSDPRAAGGGVKPGALLYSGPITITQSTEITARAKGTGDFFNGWSGPVGGVFSLEVPADSSNLRITELQYHAANPSASELAAVPGAGDGDFEYVELRNISGETISLNGVRFTDGITFDFSASSVTSLAPGQAVVVVENNAAFTARYGSGILVAGVYSGDFSNAGERVILSDANNQTIHDFVYSDDAPWPTIVDGNGPSLEVVDTEGNYSSASNWRSSAASNGTPGIQTISQPGDYNRDGFVSAADYSTWRSAFGSTTDLAADGNGDQVVDAADYSVWRDNLGASSLPVAPASSGGESAIDQSGFNFTSLALASNSDASEAPAAASPATYTYIQGPADGHGLIHTQLDESRHQAGRNQRGAYYVRYDAGPLQGEHTQPIAAALGRVKQSGPDQNVAWQDRRRTLALDRGLEELLDEELVTWLGMAELPLTTLSR